MLHLLTRRAPNTQPQEVFSGQPLRAVEQLRNTEVIPPALLGDYQKLLSSTPARRLNPAQVAESKFLNNRLVKVVAFMENISGGRQ